MPLETGGTDISGVPPEEPPAHQATATAKAAGSALTLPGAAKRAPEPAPEGARQGAEPKIPSLESAPMGPGLGLRTPTAPKGLNLMDAADNAAGTVIDTWKRLNPLAPFDWPSQPPEMVHGNLARAADGFSALARHVVPEVERQAASAAHVATALPVAGAPAAAALGYKSTIEDWRKAEEVYNIVFDGVNRSVQNILQQNDAQGAFLRAIDFMPTDTKGESQAKLAAMARNRGSIWSTVLQMTSDPLNAVGLGEEGALAKIAAFAGPSVMGALASKNEADKTNGMVWAALTGMLIGGTHLPPGATEELAARAPRFARLIHLVDRFQSGRARYESKLVRGPQPGEAYQPFYDYVGQALERGGKEESSYVLARATKAAKAGLQEIQGFIDENGNIHTELAGGRSKRLAGLLKSLGAPDVQGVVEKAMAGEYAPREASLILKNWKTLGLPYDLRAYYEEDLPLRDPRAQLKELDDAAQGKAQTYLASLSHYLYHVEQGIFANGGHPDESMWRSLIGANDATDWIHEAHVASALELLDRVGIVPGKSEELSRAVEGDLEAYDKLPPEARMVVDGYRLVTTKSMWQSHDTEYAKNFVANYLPRIDKVVQAGKREAQAVTQRARHAFTTEIRRHRELGFGTDAEGNLILTPRFKTVQEANDAIRQERESAVKNWLNPEFQTTDQNVAGIRSLAATDAAAAKRRAEAYAAEHFPLKETDFLRIMDRTLGRQVKALKTAQAVKEWERTIVSFGEGDARRQGPGAIRTAAARRNQMLRNWGYRAIDAAGMDGYLFAPNIAKLLDRSLTRTGPVSKIPGAGKALDAEGLAIGSIMWSPMVHAMNVASRFGAYAIRHPSDFTRSLVFGPLDPRTEAEQLFSLRDEAIRAGVQVAHFRRGYVNMLQGTLRGALGDLPEADYQTATGTRNLADSLNQHWLSAAHDTANNYFWRKVTDFAVSVYHVEKKRGLAQGLDEVSARLKAARLANTWAGFVRPEDTEPILHDLGRLLMFAPNWWRTWVELAVPIYRRSGIMDENQARKAATDSALNIMSLLAEQKVTGNLMNLLLSGHFQNENQPGNQDQIEVTDPAILKALQAVHYPGAANIDANTGMNPKTGGRLILENPLGRAQRDAEIGLGLDTGHPGWNPADIPGGLARVLVARLSPLIESMASVGNIDLYHTVATDTLAHTDPNSPNGISPASLLYAALMMTPGGLSIPYTLSQQQQTGQKGGNIDGPWGTKIPKSVLNNLAWDAAGIVGAWMTGVNPPYQVASKTKGISPSDQQWVFVNQQKARHTEALASLDREALTGAITPSQWKTRYQEEETHYADYLQATFNGSTSDAFGAEALAGQWEKLYSDATMKDGSLDYGKLDALQAQFEKDHTQQQISEMNSVLQSNTSKYKMVKVYDDVQQAYQKFQTDTAASLGIDVSKLRAEITAWDALYGDTPAYDTYLSQHPELQQYEMLKRSQFEETPAGMMWGLFNQSTVAYRYLAASGLTARQLEEQLAGAPTPAATPATAPAPNPTAELGIPAAQPTPPPEPATSAPNSDLTGHPWAQP